MRQVQFDQRTGDWDAAALMPAVLETKFVEMALDLERRLKFYLATRGTGLQVCPWLVEELQDQKDQQYQRDLTASLNLLLKFLQHTGQDRLLHGPSVGRGLQLGYTLTRKDGRDWTKDKQQETVNYNEMPAELMGLIAQFLEEHDVWEVPEVSGWGGWAVCVSARLTKAKLPGVLAAKVVGVVPGFKEETGYETSNHNLLARLTFPQKLGFVDVLPAISTDKILKMVPWQEVAKASAKNSFFTMPEQLVTYWIEVEGRMAWAIQVAAGRAGVRPEHYTFSAITLSQVQDKAGRNICPNGEWIPDSCAMGIFGGWEAQEAIFTVFSGQTVYLAARFLHPDHGSVKMLQCVTLPASLLKLLEKNQETLKGAGKGAGRR